MFVIAIMWKQGCSLYSYCIWEPFQNVPTPRTCHLKPSKKQLLLHFLPKENSSLLSKSKDLVKRGGKNNMLATYNNHDAGSVILTIRKKLDQICSLFRAQFLIKETWNLRTM
jgi:hypothetical protein